MENNMNGTPMVQLTTAELEARTRILIGEMDRRGTKIRRDEWQFDAERVRVRINYAHRELRIHVMRPDSGGGNWPVAGVVSVNLDATDSRFPSLDELLVPVPESAVRRSE